VWAETREDVVGDLSDAFRKEPKAKKKSVGNKRKSSTKSRSVKVEQSVVDLLGLNDDW